MRAALAHLLPMALAFAAAHPARAGAQSTAGQAAMTARGAVEFYDLVAEAPGLWPEAEIYLLPDRTPVELDARLVQVIPLPKSMREVSRRVEWRAGAGVLRVTEASPDRARATWSLPASTRACEVVAEAFIAIEPTSEGEGLRAQTITRRVTFRFLPPAPAQMLVAGYIEGYPLGEFPDPADPDIGLKYRVESNWHVLHPERYQRPGYFHRIDLDIKDLRVSPHLRLGDFAIDFPWKTLGWPQFIALDMNLVRKLEDLIELINHDGKFQVTRLVPIYGYRPPAFNLGTIGERPGTTLKVPFSMHQYGRALDFIIDEDGDLILDDLNGDGKHDIFDAVEIMHYVNILDRKYRAEGRWELVGGAGLYDHHDFIERVQTPYVHVDTRGFQSEAGTLVRWAEGWPEGVPLIWSDM